MPDLIEDYENTYSDWHSWSYVLASEVENIKWPNDLEECYMKIFLEWVFPSLCTSCSKEIRMTVCFNC